MGIDCRNVLFWVGDAIIMVVVARVRRRGDRPPSLMCVSGAYGETRNSWQIHPFSGIVSSGAGSRAASHGGAWRRRATTVHTVPEVCLTLFCWCRRLSL